MKLQGYSNRVSTLSLSAPSSDLQLYHSFASLQAFSDTTEDTPCSGPEDPSPLCQYRSVLWSRVCQHYNIYCITLTAVRELYLHPAPAFTCVTETPGSLITLSYIRLVSYCTEATFSIDLSVCLHADPQGERQLQVSSVCAVALQLRDARHDHHRSRSIGK